MSTNFEKEIAKIEEELSKLPLGSVVKKTVNGKDYYYRRIRSNGKYVEIPIDPDAVNDTKADIEKRKQLENRLKELKAINSHDDKNRSEPPRPKAMIYTGERLSNLVAPTLSFKRRECIDIIKNYVYGNAYCKVFVLFGLRRTGKTTLMCQVISDMNAVDFNKAAYIKIPKEGYGIFDLSSDLEDLKERDYKYIFIDEVTFMEDFITEASILSDIYAACGMRIVLSGTDSLGFRLSANDSLFDRCIFVHTTFIPYREFECVLGIKGIDNYISYGGTMSPSGTHYNDDFAPSDTEVSDSYLNIAIAENIQHSLEYNGEKAPLKSLVNLYQKGKLTSAINRVVEDINHEFTVKVLTRDFKSHDLSSSAEELRGENDILDRIDRDSVTKRVKEMLNILNKTEQTVKISDTEANDIKHYLRLLDLVYETEYLEWPSWKAEKYVTTITQPGLRYAQAESLVESLLNDKTFLTMKATERAAILNRVRNDILGRMMEEIVLLETNWVTPKVKARIFKLTVGKGEIDMVMQKNCNGRHACSLYEIKHSEKRVPDQYKHLKNEDICEKIESRYGKIDGKYVIYRGETIDEDGIRYINVEEYLKSLSQS